jgi:hypothetical protein
MDSESESDTIIFVPGFQWLGMEFAFRLAPQCMVTVFISWIPL